MDILKKKHIDYIVNKYYKNNHYKKYIKVINQLNFYVKESNITIEEQNTINIGGYLVYRVNGMPPLI